MFSATVDAMLSELEIVTLSVSYFGPHIQTTEEYHVILYLEQRLLWNNSFAR